MKIFRGFDQVKGIRNPVVTTGSFDGVHVGHKAILEKLRMLAEKYEGESVLISFEPHPRKVLYPDTLGKDLKLINSYDEKLELLMRTGLDNLIVVEFTREFSKITGEEFVRDYLHGILKARVVVVGFNHHFGFNQEGDYRHLWSWREKYDFEAEEIPEQEVQHERVSSTRIRKALSEGYIQRANAYLDHYYIVKGIPENFRSPTGFSFLKIPLTDECKLLPATGIYAVTVVSGEHKLKGMVVINNSHDGKGEVLVHLLEEEHDLTAKETTLLFHKMIHGTVLFSDILVHDELTAAKAEIADLIY